MDLKQLVYVSSASPLLKAADFEQILRSARSNNSRNGITGLLLFHEGNFIQALEGGWTQVDHTFLRVSTDPRHHNILKIYDRPCLSRDFSDWKMGFRDLAEMPSERTEGISDFLLDPQSKAIAEDSKGAVHKLLLTFRDSIR